MSTEVPVGSGDRLSRGTVMALVAMGLAESLFPLFFAFGCLTVAWLCVTLGLWRRP